MVAKHSQIVRQNENEDINMGSLLYELTGNAFGVSGTSEENPELLWLQDVIGQLDMGKVIKTVTLELMAEKLVLVMQTVKDNKTFID